MLKQYKPCETIQVTSDLICGKSAEIKISNNINILTLRTSKVEDFCFRTNGFLEIKTKNTIYVTNNGTIIPMNAK